MKRPYRHLVTALAATAYASAAGAAPVNQVPSCYVANKVQVTPPAADRALFIVMDETVVLDDSLKGALWQQVRPLIAPGTWFGVYRFSAFSQGKYLDVVTEGLVEPALPKAARDSVGVPTLRRLDGCLKDQGNFALNLVRSAMGDILHASSQDLARSDIQASLLAVSKAIRQVPASKRTVLLVSDMLENSSISSFYQNNGVRLIDAAAEIKKAESNKMLGDFGGANVYVMGAGIIGNGTANGAKGAPAMKVQYRDPKTLNALRDFWTQYFARSNAHLEEFGTPALLSPVR